MDFLMRLGNEKVKKAVIIILIVNAIIIVGVFFLSKNMTSNPGNNSVSEPQLENEVITDEIDQIAEDEIDESISMIFINLLPGKYELDNGIVYNFSSDGTYSGFFDDNNKNVSGYTYEVSPRTDGGADLKIFNPDRTKVVEYILNWNEDGSLVLLYPVNGKKIVLPY